MLNEKCNYFLKGNDEPDLSNFTYNKTNFNFCFVDPTNSSQCSSNTTFNLKVKLVETKNLKNYFKMLRTQLICL